MTAKQHREFQHSVTLATHERREEKLFSLEDVAEAVSHANHKFGICEDAYWGEAEISGRVIDCVEMFLMTRQLQIEKDTVTDITPSTNISL